MDIELRLDMFGLISTLLIVLLTLVIKWILKPYEECTKPVIYLNENSKIAKEVVKCCKRLNEIYNPTYVWGKNGHFQTMIHAALGRFDRKASPLGKLLTLYAADGATITYMLYDSGMNNNSEVAKKDSIILIVPGIANSSKTIYIQAFTSLFLKHGFDVVVYNHLGAHPKIKITSPRLFTYGCTDDLQIVVRDLLCRFPNRRLIGVGFSMGANVLLKFLGEKPSRQANFSFALSICQGYSCSKAMPYMREWKGLRRFYRWGISRNVKKLITRKHRESFIDFERKGSFDKIDWRKISSSSSLEELDTAINKRFASFDDVDEFYRWGSSSNYMGKIEIPTFMLNALDDPLTPEPLFEFPKKIVEENKDGVFVVTKHGGHLGFYEGGLIWPNKTTWLEHALLEYVVAMDDAVQSLNAEDDANEDCFRESRKCFSI